MFQTVISGKNFFENVFYGSGTAIQSIRADFTFNGFAYSNLTEFKIFARLL